MSVTHCDDAVGGSLCTQSLNNMPLLSLSSAKLASSTSPQKPPTTYTRVNDFGPHTELRTRFVGGDLYARATYMQVYAVLD